MTEFVNPPNFKAKASSDELWNTYLRDNMEQIKAPPNAQHAPAYAATTTTTVATSFADISANFSKTIDTKGGDILVSFSCFSESSAFDIALDDSRQGGVDGIIQTGTGGSSCGITWLLQNVVAGEHTISIQWKAMGGGTALIDNAFMPFFNVREFS